MYKIKTNFLYLRNFFEAKTMPMLKKIKTNVRYFCILTNA